MPTRTASTDHFAPRGTLSREQLIAYAEGRLAPTEQHQVEAHLESDPLARAAAEGLTMPNARIALKALDRMRPTSPSPGVGTGRIVASMVAGAFVAVFVWYLLPTKQEPVTVAAKEVITTPAEQAPQAPVEQPLVAAEIIAAHELPESLHIGHAANDRHAKAMATNAERESGIERLDSRPVDAKRSLNTADPATARLKHTPRASLQLLFLHDLELVDPRELYDREPSMRLADANVAARFVDRGAQDSTHNEMVTATYTAFMDEALYRFAQNDHKACLDDLRFLLEQYPDDVNALFYAGLCCYNLGLYTHARTFLHRAATHHVRVFDEEAQWYHALTLERLGEVEAAQEAFARIAADGGFYAAKAQVRGR